MSCILSEKLESVFLSLDVHVVLLPWRAFTHTSPGSFLELLAYTGKLLGVEYLFHQKGESFQPKDDDELAGQIDEGFEDVSDDYLNLTAAPPFSKDLATFALPSDVESETDEVCSVV